MGLNYRRNKDGEICELENSPIKVGDMVIVRREKLHLIKGITHATDRWGMKINPEYTSYLLAKADDITEYDGEVPYWLVQKVEEYI